MSSSVLVAGVQADGATWGKGGKKIREPTLEEIVDKQKHSEHYEGETPIQTSSRDGSVANVGGKCGKFLVWTINNPFFRLGMYAKLSGSRYLQKMCMHEAIG